ncbi:MAG: deoxyribonuclease IV [Clostridia bacterium]|nr:deoxyribonuclease IV [Clostridia bacterium]
MFTIGCHLSASDGFDAMAKTALSIGANTFQYFSRNPRGSKARPLDLNDIEKYKKTAAENGISVVLCHAPYTMNACSSNPGLRDLAREMMTDDLARLSHIPGALYNFHPGSHTGQGMDVGIEQIAQTLNSVLTPDISTPVLLETMAGKGSEVGGRFEELARIIEKTELSDKLGVCLDTCHIRDGGYDISEDLDAVIETFDKIVGLSRLRAIHLNDSMNPVGSHKDRHQKLGEGTLGIETIKAVINHPKLRDLPFFLETPNELDGYAKEIALLKTLREDN